MSIFVAQVNHFVMQCHQSILFGVEFVFQCAFGNYLVVFGIDITHFIAAIIVILAYILVFFSIILSVRNLILSTTYYLLIHAYDKTYTGVMWFLSLPKFVLVSGISILIYLFICFFFCLVLMDYNFSQSVPVPAPETELRILEQFYWFSVELAEHNHFRENFLVSGLKLNQQIIDYMIWQAEVHNSGPHPCSKDQFIKLSQLRANIVCDYINKHICIHQGADGGFSFRTLDYSEAIKRFSKLTKTEDKTPKFWVMKALITQLSKYIN